MSGGRFHHKHAHRASQDHVNTHTHAEKAEVCRFYSIALHAHMHIFFYFDCTNLWIQQTSLSCLSQLFFAYPFLSCVWCPPDLPFVSMSVVKCSNQSHMVRWVNMPAVVITVAICWVTVTQVTAKHFGLWHIQVKILSFFSYKFNMDEELSGIAKGKEKKKHRKFILRSLASTITSWQP